MCSKRNKRRNVKVFNILTNKNGAKTMTKHISCDCKCKFNRTTCNSNKKGIMKHTTVSVKKIIVEILEHRFVRIVSIKNITDTSVTECAKIIIVMDNVLTKKTNSIATNVTSTASVNCHIKKSKRLLYFAQSSISNHITINNYYYLLLSCKGKSII